MTTSKGGAPDGLTPEVEEIILTAIRAGASNEIAAAHAGITRQTINSWKRTGRSAAEKKLSERSDFEKRCLAFLSRIEKSSADAVLQFQARLTQIAQSKDEAVALRAVTWWLERRAKDDYAMRQELTGPDGGPIELSPSEAFSILSRIVRKTEEEE